MLPVQPSNAYVKKENDAVGGHGFIYAYCNRHGLMKKKI